MKKNPLLFLILFLTAYTRAGWAAPDEGFSGQPEPSSNELPKKEERGDVDQEGGEAGPKQFELQIGLTLFQFNYAEVVPSPLKSSEAGILPGVGLRLSRTVPETDETFYFITELANGSTTYDGTTQTGAPASGTTTDSMIDVEVAYGVVAYSFSPFIKLRPYVGASWRYWERYGQYREDYSWYDLDFGLRYEHEWSEDFAFDVDLAVKPTIGGRITVYFSGLDPTQADSTGLLGDSVGAKLSVPFHFFRRAFLPLVVTPWLEYISNGKGPSFPTMTAAGALTGTAFEPASNAYRYGVFIGTAFEF